MMLNGPFLRPSFDHATPMRGSGPEVGAAHMPVMTDAFVRKNQTGEPARSGGEFGSHKRPEGVSLFGGGPSCNGRCVAGYDPDVELEFIDPTCPKHASIADRGTAVHAALEQAALAGDTDGMERINKAATTTMWDDPSFLLGHLGDLRTDIADRRYEGRDQPEVMQPLFDQRAEVVRRLQAAGVDVPRP
jgi:hypothetical protein